MVASYSKMRAPTRAGEKPVAPTLQSRVWSRDHKGRGSLATLSTGCHDKLQREGGSVCEQLLSQRHTGIQPGQAISPPWKCQSPDSNDEIGPASANSVPNRAVNHKIASSTTAGRRSPEPCSLSIEPVPLGPLPCLVVVSVAGVVPRCAAPAYTCRCPSWMSSAIVPRQPLHMTLTAMMSSVFVPRRELPMAVIVPVRSRAGDPPARVLARIIRLGRDPARPLANMAQLAPIRRHTTSTRQRQPLTSC